MKKLLLALVPLAALALSGCGAAGCSSAAADYASPGRSCSVGAADVTFNVAVRCKCTDTGASCQAEFRNGRFEVVPAVQQCQEQASCDTEGCDVTGRTATCTATVPADVAAGTYEVLDGNGRTVGQVAIGGSGSSSCTL